MDQEYDNEFCLNCGSQYLGYEPMTMTLFCTDCGFEFEDADIEDHIINSDLL